MFSVTREQITDGYTVVVDMVDRKLSGQTETPDDSEPEEYKRRVVIEKVNEDGDLISGAALFLEDESGNLVAEWTTDGRQKELNLEPGTYYLAEERAPSGYELADEIEFTVEEPDAELATPGDASVSDTDTIVIRMVDEKKQDEPDEPDDEEPDEPSTPSDATPSNPDRPVSSDDDEPDEPETPVTPETPETITTKKKRRSSSSGGSSPGSGSGTSNPEPDDQSEPGVIIVEEDDVTPEPWTPSTDEETLPDTGEHTPWGIMLLAGFLASLLFLLKRKDDTA